MSLHPCPECSGEIKIYARTGVGAVAVCQKCKAEYIVCGVDDLHIYNGCKIRKSTVEKVEKMWNERHLHRNPDILASINPEWNEHIFDGMKLYEVRKTKPSIPVPFKVYIYCTKNGRVYFRNSKGVRFTTPFTVKNLLMVHPDAEILNGKVIGEFICDEIVEVPRDALYGNYNASSKIKNAIYYSCVLNDELIRYCGNKKSLFFWHISNLVKYDSPKELSDFRLPDYKHYGFGTWVWKRGKDIERAPQSYQFVIANEEEY